ncbi:thermonuclease family protein [Pedobacter sp.]|uniref:thermonuclease family protein n=1 Tax=Pedobacter sp. TaxID=1411316 RepID=UPI003BA8C24D
MINKQNVNQEMVKLGMAWHFKKYSSDVTYAALENNARRNRIGLWKEPNPIAPWEWRKPKAK